MTWAMLLLILGIASPVRAQMGMDLFKKPSFTKVFHPMVGKGAEYEMTGKVGADTKTRTMEMGVVGKESVEGKDGYSMEFVSADEKGQRIVGKMLMTIDDF